MIKTFIRYKNTHTGEYEEKSVYDFMDYYSRNNLASGEIELLREDLERTQKTLFTLVQILADGGIIDATNVVNLANGYLVEEPWLCKR